MVLVCKDFLARKDKTWRIQEFLSNQNIGVNIMLRKTIVIKIYCSAFDYTNFRAIGTM